MTTTDPGTKSPREIQRELEDERERLRETGRALQSKLSVGTVIDELLARTRDRGPDYAAGFGRTIRDNPIPVALIGISLAWLMAGGQRASEERFRHDRRSGRDEDGGYPPPARPLAGAPAQDSPERSAAEPLREPPPAVGPAHPLRETPASPGDIGSTPPPASPRPGSGAPDIAADAPAEAPRPSPLAGRTGPATDDETDEPLTLGDDSRTGDRRPHTPPPASRPLEGGAGPRPGETNDTEDKS